MDPNRDEVVQRLSRLRDQGLLSEEEFDEQVRSHMADDETSSAGIDESVETVKPKVDGRRAEPVAEDPTGTRGPEPGAEPQKEADDADLLSRLTGLRDSGVLSEEEFQLAVKDLLGDSRLQEGTLSEDSGDTTPVPTPPIAPVPKDPRASGSQSGETPPASDELLRRKAELDEAEALALDDSDFRHLTALAEDFGEAVARGLVVQVPDVKAFRHRIVSPFAFLRFRSYVRLSDAYAAKSMAARRSRGSCRIKQKSREGRSRRRCRKSVSARETGGGEPYGKVQTVGRVEQVADLAKADPETWNRRLDFPFVPNEAKSRSLPLSGTGFPM